MRGVATLSGPRELYKYAITRRCIRKDSKNLRYIELERLTDKSTLLELARYLFKKYESDPKRSAFSLYYRSFQMTQSFLPEIWDRILKDVRLEQEYWSIEAEINNAQQAEEEYKLSVEETKVLDEFLAHQHRINLDVEDWFLHAHILMEKYTKLFKLVLQLTKGNDRRFNKIPSRSFHKHIKFFQTEKTGILDEKYVDLIKDCSNWYVSEIKDVRDDLITHEQIGRFWGSSTSPDTFSISRFNRPDTLVNPLYSLADKYKEKFLILQSERNVFNLLSFFEANASKLEAIDAKTISDIRRKYGRSFPDIPELYNKMNTFFSSVNDYLISQTEK